MTLSNTSCTAQGGSGLVQSNTEHRGDAIRDIVERLRSHVNGRGGPAKDEAGKFVGTVWPMMLEAADEIERLRAAQGGSGGVLDHLTDTKPVAWRHRFQEWQPWEYSSKDPHDAEQIVEPLYAQPASSQARSEWQPIETAPRDGKPILGYSTESVAYVCWHRASHWIFHQNYRGDTLSFYPTHWMPLPALPALSRKDAP